MQKQLKEGLGRIERGEKPIFLDERNIFERSSQGTGGRKVDEDEVRTLVEQILKERCLMT